MTLFHLLGPCLQGARATLSFSRAPRVAVDALKVACRYGSHGPRRMEVTPSRFEYNKFKDDFHFFTLLGLLPIGVAITCANLFVGPAELRDIPEGYEPEEWEYFKGPIQRWFIKYIYPTVPQIYETNMHYCRVSDIKRRLQLKERKVRHLMAKNQDYKGWYFVPYNKTRIEKSADYWKDVTKLPTAK